MNETRHKAKQEVAARERLLTAALELFTRKGYAASSVREIVEAAGVTKPVLYYYFGSKEGIYLDLMLRAFSQLEPILDGCRQEAGPVSARLLTLCDRIFLLFIREINVARLMYAIYYGPPQGAPFFDFRDYHLKLHLLMGEMVGAGIQAGELQVEHAEYLSWVVIGALNVVLEEQLCQHEPRIGREGLEQMLRLIFKGIGKE